MSPTRRGRPGGRPLRLSGALCLAALSAAAGACGPPSPSVGTLSLAFTLPAEQAAGLSEIRVEPDWGGVNRGPERDADWQRVPALAPVASLPVTGTRSPEVARGPVPAGRYDRVYVATPRVTARRPDGRTVALTSHIEPIVAPVTVPAGGEARMEIELVVLPLPPWQPPGWAVFVKAARPRP